MKRNLLSNDAFLLKTEQIINRIVKRIDADDIKIILELQPGRKLPIEGIFQGNAQQLKRSSISIYFCTFAELKGMKKRLRRWISGITIAFIHEYCHYILFKQMSCAEREESNRKYNEYKYFQDKEEIETWNLTIKLLKKYGYLRAKTTREELKNFIKPKNYKFPRGTYNG